MNVKWLPPGLFKQPFFMQIMVNWLPSFFPTVFQKDTFADR